MGELLGLPASDRYLELLQIQSFAGQLVLQHMQVGFHGHFGGRTVDHDPPDQGIVVRRQRQTNRTEMIRLHVKSYSMARTHDTFFEILGKDKTHRRCFVPFTRRQSFARLRSGVHRRTR